VFEILGMAGIAISVLAYLPQVVHLIRERCSAGVSRRAWAMWILSSLLIGALALHRRDPVFVLLQLSSLTSATLIVFFASRYRGMVCPTHMRFARELSSGGSRAPGTFTADGGSRRPAQPRV
jgi:uncharacterized protein with PQ loop repeat